MKKFLLAAVIVAGTAGSAFANSCTAQGGECRAWANGQGSQSASFVAKCNAEVGRCKARCSAGQKVFIGVSSSPQQYPVDSCK